MKITSMLVAAAVCGLVLPGQAVARECGFGYINRVQLIKIMNGEATIEISLDTQGLPQTGNPDGSRAVRIIKAEQESGTTPESGTPMIVDSLMKAFVARLPTKLSTSSAYCTDHWDKMRIAICASEGNCEVTPDEPQTH